MSSRKRAESGSGETLPPPKRPAIASFSKKQQSTSRDNEASSSRQEKGDKRHETNKTVVKILK